MRIILMPMGRVYGVRGDGGCPPPLFPAVNGAYYIVFVGLLVHIGWVMQHTGGGRQLANPKEEQIADQPREEAGPWKMLVVDDDESVLTVTRLAVIDFTYLDRPLEILYARSGAEARDVYAEHADIALILLDVVMESDEAGLEFARFVREEQDNRYVRIILRTGQAGQFSISEVTRTYDINDFCEKVDLTADRLFVALYTALRDREFLLQQDALRDEIGRSHKYLQANNEKLEVFARMASHDLQAPLRKLVWRLDRAEEALQPLSGTNAVEQELIAARRCCTHMSALFDSMMKYAQLTGTRISKRSVQLSTVLTEAINNLESDIRHCGGVVSLPDKDATLVGESNLLALMFQNLLSNALKNTRPNMVPMVNVVAMSDQLPGTSMDCIRVDVTDQGVGFDPGLAELIFKPFERLSSETEYMGAGLGLSIVQHIAEEHGGAVRATGEPGKGATFSVYLPT